MLNTKQKYDLFMKVGLEDRVQYLKKTITIKIIKRMKNSNNKLITNHYNHHNVCHQILQRQFEFHLKFAAFWFVGYFEK